MSGFRLIFKSLTWFWKRNLFLALGIAISTAVLTGALIVGDSVKYSLNQIVEQRLGKVSHILLSGDRFFRSELAADLNQELLAAPVLKVEGVAVAGGGSKRINDVQIFGVDSLFDNISMLDDFYASLKEDEIIISSNLAERLNVKPGDGILLRMTRASLIPLNAPFVSDAENILSIRVTVKNIASASEMGMFNIQNSQTAPFNAFINAEWLQEMMELGKRANMLLFSLSDNRNDELMDQLRSVWRLGDAGLKVRQVKGREEYEILSERVFMDEAVSKVIMKTFESSVPIITYFVNAIEKGSSGTPYSFVSAAGFEGLNENGIIINTWLAQDLGAKAGDSLLLKYFAVGPLRELEEKSRFFIVDRIVPLAGIYSDAQLMPDIPGLSTAGNCRDWDTGVPVELDAIRDKDEDYWTRYKGTPKAFVSFEAAAEMWANRFGTLTAVRINSGNYDRDDIANKIMQEISPESLGFEIRDVRKRADQAAGNGVNFSELFGGLSFFLLAGAILLAALLYLLNLEQRKEQLITLSALGIPVKNLRRMILWEGMIIALAGALAGLFLAIIYNKLVFQALNGIWSDIVRTNVLVVDIQISTLLSGFFASLLIAFLSLLLPLNHFLKRIFWKKEGRGRSEFNKKLVFYGAFAFITGAGILVTRQFVSHEIYNPSVFFSAGGMLLVAGILFSIAYILRLRADKEQQFSFTTLSLKNASSNLTRSMTIILLLALGAFLVISTGSNRKDLFVNANDRTSGTGGFLFYSESTAPVLQNLNDPGVKYEFGLSGSYSFTQLRVADGDDASCLNLNQISNPRILGVNADDLKGRFSFVSSIDALDMADPWSSLDMKMEGGLVPAIADETVIKWGLIMNVGDTLHYKNALGEELGLVLIGGLAPSIFQGSVLISEANFLKHFPSSSGSGVYLIEGKVSDTAQIFEEVSMSMRDYGWSMDYGAKRLTEFNSITNTYLSIFMVLGALGLLLGTIGLSVILFKSVLERKYELALLKAVGYSKRKISQMIIREYSILLFAGLLIGSVSAVLATLPTFLSANSEISIGFILIILGVLILNGLIWIRLMAGLALRNRSISLSLKSE